METKKSIILGDKSLITGNGSTDKSLILGIDPGFTGALALYDVASGNLVDIIDMPLLSGLTFGYKAHGSQDIDCAAIVNFIQPYQPRILAAVVERVSASPGAGVSSMFRFGEGYGILRGITAAFHLKTMLAIPGVWKPSMGLSRDKGLSLIKARELSGEANAAKYFGRKKDNGRAEAFLLAVFGRISLNLPAPSDGDKNHISIF